VEITGRASIPLFNTHKNSTIMVISNDNNPEDVLKQHFAAVSNQSSIAPIAYSEGVTSQNMDITSSNQSSSNKHKKVSIIGCGQVGMAIAFAILNQEIAGSIALVDINEDKIDGEVKDLRQGSAFHQRVRIEGSSDYKVTAGSNLIIVTAGAAQKPGMSRLSLVEINGTLFYL
jgi:threonine dehydrogenase-like Zn-dependent dehydrogenase